MSYWSKLEEEITCCLNPERHIIADGVYLACGGKACKQCTASALVEKVQCGHCSNIHELNKQFASKTRSIQSTINLLIQSNYAEIFEMLSKRHSANVSASSKRDSSAFYKCTFIQFQLWSFSETLKSKTEMTVKYTDTVICQVKKQCDLLKLKVDRLYNVFVKKLQNPDNILGNG
jgi:hypothetical protein